MLTNQRQEQYVVYRDQRQGFFERMAPLALVGVLGLGLGAAGGIWFSHHDLPPTSPVLSDEAPTVDRPETGLANITLAMATSAARPEISRPATSRPAAVRPAARASRTLYTCSKAKHLEATSKQPGACPTCGAKLVSIELAPFGVRALAWYGKHGETPRAGIPVASQPVASRAVPGPVLHTQPTSSPGRSDQTLYTCVLKKHIDSTSPRPGTCGRCGMALLPVDKVDHGIHAIFHYARKQQSTRPEHPPLYACATRLHIKATTDQPGQCSICGLKLLPIEQVGHASRAVAFWTKQHQADSARPTSARQTETVDPRVAVQQLYTCPDIQHVDATGRQPGRCTLCGLELRPADQVLDFHAIKAVEAYIRKVTSAGASQASPTSPTRKRGIASQSATTSPAAP